MVAEERFYNVPLGDAYDYIRTKRVRRAVKIVQQFIARHTKTAIKNVRVSNVLNSLLWARGIQKPPRKIKIKVIMEGEIAKAYLVDEQIKKPEPKAEKSKGAKEVKSSPAEAKAEEVKKEAPSEKKAPQATAAKPAEKPASQKSPAPSPGK